MKLSQILREATEKYLWTGITEDDYFVKQRYICFALNDWNSYNPGHYDEVCQLKMIVHSEIDGYTTVRSWLERKHRKNVDAMTDLELQTVRKELVEAICSRLEGHGN